MVILVNLTGLKNIYWIPAFNKDSSRAAGIWYADVKFLFVQVTIYNKKMGETFIKTISDKRTWSNLHATDN